MKKITIIGLGLIGGSLAAACRKAFPRAQIIGISRTRRALTQAKRKGWIHKGYQDFLQAMGEGKTARGSEPCLIVLCTPVDTLKDFLRGIDRLAPPGTIVTDAGSVKGFLVRWADRERWRRIQFVGAHPMAGSHERGIDHARPNLFAHSLTFVTPGRNSHGSALRTVIHFWKKISHRVAVVSPEKHDRVTAEVSHLPHLLASVLVASVSSQALPFAASGFLDMTRIAASDANLWFPIFTANRKELIRSLKNFETSLKDLKKILIKGDFQRLKQALQRSQKLRVSL